MYRNKRKEQKIRLEKFRGKLNFPMLLKRIDQLEAIERMTYGTPEHAGASSFLNDTDEAHGYWPDIFVDSSIKKIVRIWWRDRFFQTR